MNNYVASESNSKELARNKLLNLVKNDGLNILNCLSLPNSNFCFEEKLRKEYPNSCIETVEYQQYTYNKGKQRAKELNIVHKKNDIFKHLVNSDKQYDFIWLDLCGQLKPTLINQLIPIVQGQYTSKEAIIALTIMRSRENFDISFYGANNLQQMRCSTLINVLKQYAKFNDVKLKLLNVHRYITNSPMQLLTFKLIKR